MKTQSERLSIVIGDALVVLLVTLIGFMSHNESPLDLVPRFLATWIPFTLAWVIASYTAGLYQTESPSFSRIILTALLAAPLGGLGRSLWLNTVVLPTFVLVMAAVLAAGMLLWRWVWPWVRNRLAN